MQKWAPAVAEAVGGLFGVGRAALVGDECLDERCA